MSNPPFKKKVLTDRLLSSWIRCKRKAWLDCYENTEKKVWSAHRSLQLDHQYKSLSAFTSEKQTYGFDSCLKGELNVVGIRLKSQDSLINNIEGHPLLIHRVKGPS